MLKTILVSLFAFATVSTNSTTYFAPAHRLTGIGVARTEMTPELLAERVKLMIDAQTFFFLRDPQAVLGAQRIESAAFAPFFQAAEKSSGIPATLIKAIAYLESFGDPLAQSPGGPRGIMQVSDATARDMGLRLIYTTQYRVVKTTRAVKNKRGKVTYRQVTTKVPHQVLLRDERLVPERAIPAAANYLARISQTLGGIDWAVAAYHCGVGCMMNLRSIVARSEGFTKPITVAQMFFAANPAVNRELYEQLKREMDRDWSPTYWFRVMRAQELLALYREDRATFTELANYYRSDIDRNQRPQHRLMVWLKSSDLAFQSVEDIRREDGKRLARVFDDPAFFGFTVGKEIRLEATPSAIGTLVYIAFETHRLYDAMKPRGERFVPLEVTSLVRTLESARTESGTEAIAHSSGQVFDIRYDALPPAEKEALQFILDDMGYMGYLGFIDESPGSGVMHIGCSPSSRAFFSDVFRDALAAKRS